MKAAKDPTVNNKQPQDSADGDARSTKTNTSQDNPSSLEIEVEADTASSTKEIVNKRSRTKQLTSQTCPMTGSEQDDFFGSHEDIIPASVKSSSCEQSEQDSGDDCDSIRSMVSALTTTEHEGEQESSRSRTSTKFRCLSWTRERGKPTAIGCLSSALILTMRLLLDMEPSSYVIHSFVVFVDMLLIHLFAKTVWLSVAGEILTIVLSLSFHFTKEPVYEFIETTLIAVICSLHMINSRSQTLGKVEFLEEIIEQMSQSQQSIRSSMQLTMDPQQLAAEFDMECGVAPAQGEGEPNVSVPGRFGAHHLAPIELRKRGMRCGQHFFEHFLDGAAGVMYTSFAGLIVDGIINYGKNGK